MLGQIDGVRFEGSDSFLPVQCSGTKAIISGMATRHMIDHHVGTCGMGSAFVRVDVCDTSVISWASAPCKRKTPLPSLHQLQSTLSYYSYYQVDYRVE